MITLGSAVAGTWAAVRKIRRSEEADDRTAPARVIGGMIMDSTTMLMLSESNRLLHEAVVENTHARHAEILQMIELRHAMNRLADKL